MRQEGITKHDWSLWEKTVTRHTELDGVGDVVEDVFVWFPSQQKKSKLTAFENGSYTSDFKTEHGKLCNANEVSLLLGKSETNIDFIHLAIARNLSVESDVRRVRHDQHRRGCQTFRLVGEHPDGKPLKRREVSHSYKCANVDRRVERSGD